MFCYFSLFIILLSCLNSSLHTYTHAHTLILSIVSRDELIRNRSRSASSGCADSDVTGVQVFRPGGSRPDSQVPFSTARPSDSSWFPRGSEVGGPSSASIPHPAALRPATYKPPIFSLSSSFTKELFIRSDMTRDDRANLAKIAKL